MLNGSTLYKLRVPLPAIDKADEMPQSIQELIGYMRKNYHVSPNWWQPAFSEYTPSKDIADAFQAASFNNASVHDELRFGDIDTPNDDESELDIQDDIQDDMQEEIEDEFDDSQE